MSAAFGSGNTVGVGPNTTTKIIHVLLKIALPLLAVAYLLLDVEFFASLSTKGRTFTRGGSRHIMCDVGVPEFIVFVDAGSTGCRAHTFRVNSLESTTDGRLFSLTTIGKKVKSEHPLAWLSGKSAKDVEKEIVPMLRGAMAKIERIEEEGLSKGGRKGKKTRVPLYVWATAGMRILTDKEQIELWRSVASVVQKSLPRFAIGVEKEHFKTIDGEDEGFYAWLAANYLVGVDVTSIGADVDGFGGLPEEERDRLLRETTARKP